MEVLDRPTERNGAVTADGPLDPPTAPFVPGRLPFLDGLRAVACLTVVIMHLRNYLDLNIMRGVLSGRLHWLIYLTPLAKVAVGLFIVISGFCLMLPVIRKGGALSGGARRFLGKRARRILPPYYAALMLSLVCLPSPLAKHDILYHVLLIHNLDPHTIVSINGPFWSIAVECQLYLLLPAFVWVWRRLGAARALSIVLPAAFLVSLPCRTDFRWGGATPLLCPPFLLGMVAAAIAFGQGANWRRLRLAVPWRSLAVFLGVALLIPCITGPEDAVAARNSWILYWLTGLFGLCLLVMLSGREGAAQRGGLRSFLQWKPLVVIGSFSYSIYLLHACLMFPFGSFLWPWVARLDFLPRGAMFFLLMAAETALILPACYLFHLAYEKPCMNSAAGRERSRG